MEMSSTVGRRKVGSKRMADHPYHREREGLDSQEDGLTEAGELILDLISSFDTPFFLY